MAGYPITNLKKADRISAQDAIPVQQDGVTRMFEAGVMDQAVIVKSSGSQSSGIVRKEETFVLKSETLINFTLENAAGRIVQDNEYVDNAEAASGWIIHIVNVSGIQHTVIHGANSWPIPAGETLVFYWTGSRFTLHNVVLNNLTVRGNTKLMNVSALQALAAANKIPVIGTDDVLKYTTPADITNGLATKTEVNNALTNFKKPSVNKVFEQDNGTVVLRNAIYELYGNYDPDNYHYFKYLVIDNNGNSLTEFVKFKDNSRISFTGTVSNGITRTAQNLLGTIGFSSISKITLWEISQSDFDEINALANYDKVNQQIANNTDLDNLKNQGWYFCPNNTTASTILHHPRTQKDSFGLRVVKVKQDASGNLQQIFYSEVGYVYKRAFNGTSWTDWEKFTTETDLVNYEKTDIGTSMGTNTTQTITLEQNCALVFVRAYNSEGKGFYQLYLCSQITSLSNIQVYLLHSGGATNYTNIIISSNASDKITITTTNFAINRIKILYL